ncbi:MAG: type II toxin-antitoxin system VapC family toxin [Thermoflexales bacterium]|nr:type II toxin-antitoxin system VapC family toxin [Thermoflexales bacterium]
MLDLALRLDVERVSDGELHRRALQLARAFSLPAAYDAHYLALAEQLGADFWTADLRLARAIQDRLPWVHRLGES